MPFRDPNLGVEAAHWSPDLRKADTLTVQRIRTIVRLSRLLRSEDGQTLVLASLCMVVLVGFLGLSVDAGVLRYQKRLLQNVADAAAIAGALQLPTCGSSANCSSLQVAAQAALTENGFTGFTVLLNCAKRSGTKLELTINNAPCAVPSDPNKGQSSYVEVVVSKPTPTLFARVLGVTSVLLMARAEATQPPVTCVYVLDPTGSNALVADSGTSISTDCRAIDESNSSSSAQCTSSTVTAPVVALVGDGTASNCSVNGTLQLNAGMPRPADPLSSLAKPPVPTCGASAQGSVLHGSPSALTLSGTATLYADHAYCGGITITNGAKVTFQPGVYVLGSGTSPGGLSIDVGATVTGRGVTFYNYGSSGPILFGYTSFSSGGVTLVAPSSGTYSGVLFFQDPRNSSQATLLGNSAWNTVLQGAYYFPAAKVLDTYSGPVAYNLLIAYDVEFAYSSAGYTGTSTFASNYSSLADGSPLSNAGAFLVQ